MEALGREMSGRPALQRSIPRHYPAKFGFLSGSKQVKESLKEVGALQETEQSLKNGCKLASRPQQAMF
jgi:hypothetical protein